MTSPVPKKSSPPSAAPLPRESSSPYEPANETAFSTLHTSLSHPTPPAATAAGAGGGGGGGLVNHPCTPNGSATQFSVKARGEGAGDTQTSHDSSAQVDGASAFVPGDDEQAGAQRTLSLPRLRSDADCACMAQSAIQREVALRSAWVDDLEELTDSPGNDQQQKATYINGHYQPNAADGDGTDGSPAPPRATLRGFFHISNLTVAAVPFVCGTLNGYTLGYVAPYTQLYRMSTNCALYTAQRGCEAVPFADCVWRTTTVAQGDGTVRSLGYCGWPSITCRATYPNDGWMGGGGDTALAEASCLRDGRCTWSYSAGECQNPSGFSASYTGLFAGSIIAGSMFGAIGGGPLVTSMGARLTFVLSGFFSLVCSVMGHIDAETDEFWVLVVERFVLGFFMGLITVACPLYVNVNAEPLYRRKLGTLFQVFTTFGVFLAGTIGLGVGQTVPFRANRDANMSGRLQGLASGQTALSLALIALGILCSESKVRYGKRTGGLNQNEYSYRDMMAPLLMSVVVNGTMRLTGFNAILNFAPTILGGLGLAPLVGNTIMTIFNFTGTLVSIPLDSFFSIRSIFLFGSCFISCMCLFLCGVAVYPSVASESVTNGCAITGIIVFTFAFEVFVGPSFYVLCQEMFPPSFRPRGNSFAQLWQFIINLVINVCYPIAVERFSGGPSGNQHKGQSIVFMFFGAVGLVCFALEFFFLELWEENKATRLTKAALPGGKMVPPKLEDASDPHTAVSKHGKELSGEGNVVAGDGEGGNGAQRDTSES